MAGSLFSSVEKTSSQLSSSSKSTYQELVSSLKERNLNLSDLDNILQTSDCVSEDGRAAAIEFPDGGVTVRRFQRSVELFEYMTVEKADSSCNRRLYLLEGLPSNYIEILGSHLQVDPIVFAQQVKCGSLEPLRDVRDVPLLSSHPTSKTSFTVRYNELRDFADGIRSFDIQCVNQLRRISTTFIQNEFDRVGFVRRKASFWYRLNGENGWDALVLLDPPTGDTFYVGRGPERKRCWIPNTPYRGGYIDFSPRPGNPLENTSVGLGPERTSAFDDLCYYWTDSPEIQHMNFASPVAVTFLFKRYFASHYMLLVQYYNDLLIDHEYSLHRATKFANISAASLEQCWAGLQYLNDRVANHFNHVESAIYQFGVCGTLGNAPGQADNDPTKDDLLHISRQLHTMKRRTETVISSLTGLISIIETKRMKDLSNLGMLFLPLAVTSGIFSMSGEYAPGNSSFWVYWAVAVPLVAFVFIIGFSLNSGPALLKSWQLKLRLLKLVETQRTASVKPRSVGV